MNHRSQINTFICRTKGVDDIKGRIRELIFDGHGIFLKRNSHGIYQY